MIILIQEKTIWQNLTPFLDGKKNHAQQTSKRKIHQHNKGHICKIQS